MNSGHIAATASSSDMPVFEEKLCGGDQILSLVRHKAGKMTSLFNVASFALLVPSPHSVFFMPQSASCAPACKLAPENASFVCTRRGSSSFSRPRKMFPRVRRPLLFWGKNKHQRLQQTKTAATKFIFQNTQFATVLSVWRLPAVKRQLKVFQPNT